jgi:hypothetical protein
VAGSLVQTDRTGVANAEAASGRGFDDLLADYVGRLFLSGTGLNNTAALNYTYKHLTEPQTGYRSLPFPAESVLTDAAASVSGSVKPASPAYVRIKGSGSEVAVSVETGPSGQFHGLLVALDRPFVPNLALPVDHFDGMVLDNPFPGVFTPGESVTISGGVSDLANTQIFIEFTRLEEGAEEIQFEADVVGGRFAQTVVFASSQAGSYELVVYSGVRGELLPEAGRFRGVVVTEGTGTVDLPVEYFSSLTLDATLPTAYQAGTPNSVSGIVSDSGVEVLLLLFVPESVGEEIRVQTSVVNGRFRKGFVFTPDQAGTYALSVYGGPAGGSLPHLGAFSPVTVSSSGNERVRLPVDIFDGVVLDQPLSTSMYVGGRVHISGQVADASITQIALGFAPADGGASLDSFWDVTGSRFAAELDFTAEDTGTYELLVYGGVAGQSLPSLDSFSPVEVLSARPSAELALTALTWTSAETGGAFVKTLVIHNLGSQDLSASFTTSDGPFTASPPSLTIAPGDSAAASITFSPTSAGTTESSLLVATNDPDRPSVSVSLSGTALAPASAAILLRQSSLSWSGVVLGATVEAPVTILNTGGADLVISAISVGDGPFSVDLTGITLTPGDSTSVSVGFSPTDVGTFTGTLAISSNDLDSPSLQVGLSATAVEEGAATGQPTDFNADGVTNFSDFIAFAKVYGASAGDSDYDARFDLNANGSVEFGDFIAFAQAYGQ